MHASVCAGRILLVQACAQCTAKSVDPSIQSAACTHIVCIVQHSVDPGATTQPGLINEFAILDSRTWLYILREFPAGILWCHWCVGTAHQTKLVTWIGWPRSGSDGPRRAHHVYTAFLWNNYAYHSTIQTKVHLPNWCLV